MPLYTGRPSAKRGRLRKGVKAVAFLSWSAEMFTPQSLLTLKNTYFK